MTFNYTTVINSLISPSDDHVVHLVAVYVKLLAIERNQLLITFLFPTGNILTRHAFYKF